jgi:broad specificity phosphatase PhoE
VIDKAWFVRYIGRPIADRTLTNTPVGELLLVRHAAPVPREERGPEDFLDPPLSPFGQDQAAELGKAMRHMEPLSWYSSPMRRAKETAERASGGGSVVISHDLREVEIVREEWEPQIDPRDSRLWAECSRAFENTGLWASYPCAESGDELRARAHRVIDEISVKQPEGVTAVVTHGAFINGLLAALLDHRADMFFQPGHCSISRIRFAQGRHALGSLNEVQHLPLAMRSS